jgi:hypothetical protein
VPVLRRRTPLPPGVRTELGLAPRERVLTAAPLADGRWVAATMTALVVATSGGPERHGWESVDSAVWAEGASMLQVTWVGSSRSTLLEFADTAGYLPEVVRERVEASVVLSRKISVRGSRGVKIAVRRSGPGGELITQVVPDRGVRIDEPDVVARIAVELADLRDATGMPAAEDTTPELPRLDSNQRPSD